ncbi:MAG TPA: peroxiredoxin [Rhizobacter sp.]|nr:peroxiredoxin [Rhizobacter sp.]
MTPRHSRAQLWFGLLLAGTALHAFASLKEGQPAPDFKAPASLAGKAFTYSLRDALKKGPVVVYFYPAAFTTGCSIQAHTFSENVDKFTAAGASIVGVSLDNIAQLNEFSADPQSCAGKIPVASDADGAIARAFDVAVSETPAGRKNSRGQEIDHGRAERSTFVVTPDGKVAATVGGVAPDVNVHQALAVVQQLANQKKP